DTRERTGEYDVSRFKRVPMRANLVGEPGNAESRMTEYSGSQARLLDFGIAIHDAPDPSQIDVQRTNRPAAHSDAGGRPVVGDRINDLARVLDTRIHNFDRRHYISGRFQNIS